MLASLTGGGAMPRFFRAVALAALVAGGSAAAQVPASVDPGLIPAYQLLRPGLAVGGKPSPEALLKLKEQGFRTVIDLRSEAEGLAEEKAAVEGLGLRYVSVPMTAASFKREDALVVGRLLADQAAGPVLLHCASSNRVGGVLAVLEAEAGKPTEEALAVGRKAGLQSDSMVEAVKRVLATPATKP
jgi:uncharacterized protein (TIGR01244 family)